MNKRAKLLDAKRNNPRDWRIKDLLLVSKQFGVECQNNGCSYHVFGFSSVEMDVTMPAHRFHQTCLYPPIPAIGGRREGVKEMTTATIKKIKSVKPPYPFEAYSHIITQLQKEDGDGFLITFPDLPGCVSDACRMRVGCVSDACRMRVGCVSDGATEAEAVANGKDAFRAWVSARKDAGKEIPEQFYRPDTVPEVSGKFVTRLPKSVHTKLAERAKAEGVSLNTLVLALVAEGLGRRVA